MLIWLRILFFNNKKIICDKKSYTFCLQFFAIQLISWPDKKCIKKQNVEILSFFCIN